MTSQQPDLNMDGPFSPEQTRDAAHALAEGVRYLNHATHPGNDGGLEYPSDVYDLLGALYTATGRLPQLLDQVGKFLIAQAELGRIADSHSRNPVNQSLIADLHLSDAALAANILTVRLQEAQNAISGLHVKDDGDG